MLLTNIRTMEEKHQEVIKNNNDIIARLKEALANTNHRDKVRKVHND